ncbi:MAG TPA: hypothetical protein VHE54_11160 [Puia sp.]|nr:hypothetical protein [Puia sp.]
MKLRLSLGIALLFSWVLFSCNKDGSRNTTASQGNAKLSLSSASVQKGQPMVASLPSGVAALSVRWSISPSAAVHVTPGKGQAMVLFANPGQYKVTAYYGSDSTASGDSSTGVVYVADSVYVPPPPPSGDTLSLAGDQILIAPVADSAGNLVLLVRSVNSGPCFPSFVYTEEIGPNVPGPITITLHEVVSGSVGDCNGALNPATSYIFLNPQQNTKLPNGTYPFQVNVNRIPFQNASNTSYQGTLVVTDTGDSFTWPYSSGVTIAPLQISR